MPSLPPIFSPSTSSAGSGGKKNRRSGLWVSLFKPEFNFLLGLIKPAKDPTHFCSNLTRIWPAKAVASHFLRQRSYVDIISSIRAAADVSWHIRAKLTSVEPSWRHRLVWAALFTAKHSRNSKPISGPFGVWFEFRLKRWIRNRVPEIRDNSTIFG